MIRSGQRFGKLTTVAWVQRPVGPRWQCVCDCGNTSYVRSSNLSKGRTRSCGCSSGEHSRLRKLTRADVIAIRNTHGPVKDTAKEYGIDPSLVSRIRRGIRSAHITKESP